jgi:hypothetical protein
VFLKLNV